MASWCPTGLGDGSHVDKKRKTGLTMGTHSGTFQCDEALGIWLLRRLPKWSGATLVRSRNPEVLAPLDIVIDVGGTYDPQALRFDHHQRGFFETFDGEKGVATKAEEATGKFKTKLSACGLVYKHFGREILQSLYPALQGPRLEAVYVKLYKDMVEGLDAIDNGIEVASEPRYREGTGLSARIGRMNSRWNGPDEDSAMEDKRFEAASQLAGQEFMEQVSYLVECWLPARDLVEAALLKRHQVDPSGELLLFESGGMPWKQHLYELEREHSVDPLVKFVFYQDQAKMWRIQAVTAEGTDFTNRLSLPAPWRGVRDDELSKVAGIEGCCFCHMAGFIGGNKTLEGALAMGRAALKSA
eukprot:CAMPEP_0197844618 /NCGR_PEP_ID=MMETSP1438-20131217/1619_1 /TAXON_ID=1461541 /ORGANISM="Pterosperma sp., Strain CCMP1384" /LENGTH=355 /DNA_ID=CAMNT_0043455531 /DNA_START=107 /DNA_END=1177 /DNA_ORIENTATION=-